MAECLKLTSDPTDELLSRHQPSDLDKSKDQILFDLDVIWFGKGESLKKLRKCLRGGSRWVLRKTTPIQEQYIIGNNMGNPGSYGCVKSCIHKITKEKFAVKTIKKWIFPDRKLTKVFFKDLRQEIRLMNEVQDHPSIIRINRVFESIDVLFIIMSPCEGGELFQRIQANNGFSEKHASRIFHDMLSAIYYLHSRGIVHCDLKPENFLFKNRKTEPNEDAIKLIDFGMAKVIRWRKYHKRMRGTPYYMAPEVIEGRYNSSCDMWSMGIILFVMVYGFPPFFQHKPSQVNAPDGIYSKIAQGFEPKVKSGYGPWFPRKIPVSHEFKDLLARLLRINISARMTAEEALAHPWISRNCDLQTEPLCVIKSLRLFRRTCALKNDILRVLCECRFLNRTQETAVRETFRRIDTDGDGVITLEELFRVMSDVDPEISKEEVREIIYAVDLDENNTVLTIDDFLSARINRKVTQNEERLRKVFQSIDIDRNGKLSSSDICSVLESVSGRRLPLKEAKKHILAIEGNIDGEIDYEVFLKMFIKSNVTAEMSITDHSKSLTEQSRT